MVATVIGYGVISHVGFSSLLLLPLQGCAARTLGGK
jgi:hypothetical protein